MKVRPDKRLDAGKVHIALSRDDLAALAARAKGFRNGSSTTARLEMDEAHRRERAMTALLAVLARTKPHLEDAEPQSDRRNTGRRKSPARERQSGRKHTRWTDDD